MPPLQPRDRDTEEQIKVLVYTLLLFSQLILAESTVIVCKTHTAYFSFNSAERDIVLLR